MLMSSRIKSGGSWSAAASANRPRGNDRTSYPCCRSMSSSSFRFAGLSSTIMMLPGDCHAAAPAPLCDVARFLQQSGVRAIVFVLVGKSPAERVRDLGIFASLRRTLRISLSSTFLVAAQSRVPQFF